MSKGEVIGLHRQGDWQTALSSLPHGPAHTHWYNAALQKSVEGDIVLFVYSTTRGKAVCPLVIREYQGHADVATPYGFGGFSAVGDCGDLPGDWEDFARSRNYVCAYLGLTPWFAHPFSGHVPGKDVFVLDLHKRLDEIVSSMRPATRYELRKSSYLLNEVQNDVGMLHGQIQALYYLTLDRVGATATYRFSNATLGDWFTSTACLIAAIGRPAVEAAAVCFYTKDVGDYFLLASTEKGRRYTRILLWDLTVKLKNLGVRALNLGGGAARGDSLEAFKKSFGGERYTLSALQQVFDFDTFSALCGSAVSVRNLHYFPPYRSVA